MRRSGSAFDATILPTRSGAYWCSWPSAAAWNVRARDAGRAERLEPRAQLARRLVRERDGEDLVGAKRARRDLVRDPVRDRRRLAGAGAREDADGPAHGLDRAPLLGVQLHRVQPYAAGSDGTVC